MLVILFYLFLLIFLIKSTHLLHSLIILESLSFFVLLFFSMVMAPSASSDFFILALFSIFVMEGVIALSGMITMVSHAGSDYVSSSTISKL